MNTSALTHHSGWHEDGWTGLDCYLEVETSETLNLAFFLPEQATGGSAEKLVTVCDGTGTTAVRVARGEMTRLTLAPKSVGPTPVQIYVAAPEPASENDDRILGVHLTIRLADGSDIAAGAASGRGRQVATSDLHADHALASQVLHRGQYLLQVNAEAPPADPVLHFLMIGHLLGLTPNAKLPITPPPVLAWQSDGTCNVELPISLRAFADSGQEGLLDEKTIESLSETIVDKVLVSEKALPAMVAERQPEPEQDKETIAAEDGPAGTKPRRRRGKRAAPPAPVTAPPPCADGGVPDAVGAQLSKAKDSEIGAQAYIEGGFCTQDSGGLVFGWALHDPDARVAFVTEAGTVVPMSDCFRRFREDVMAAFPDSKWSQLPTAFIGFIPDLKSASDVRLVLDPGPTETVIARRRGFDNVEGGISELARQIFAIETPIDQFAERTIKADWPLLSRSISRRRSGEPEALRSVRIGKRVGTPKISIIVPLYGRIDFMEAQIMEFARDPFMRECCEVIYVLDDPPRWQQAETLARSSCALFDFPVTLVGNHKNNGFSGANNLGVRSASAAHLLFLNSDVIPQAPGWLERVFQTYGSAPDIGAVGPRLVYPDGGIQHAGMDFRYNTAFRVWTNMHPAKGFAPELDTGPETEEVPAVTGACLLMSREDLNAIGGWDEGYLIGDFEDSHLCLALRSRGRRIIYDRRVELVHLERQSFGRLGEADFRQKVVIANAARHQGLWAELLGNSDPSA